MAAREFDRVEDWESRSVEGDDLQSLASREFSGAVRAGGTWLFLLNGRVVGEFGGTAEGVAQAGTGGTAYTAPHPALPLLLTMRERGGETRGRYYTNDTPLAEVDETLASSNFTGYVELSENVLSGDYYVIYYGGRSMSVAFIGESGELLTGEEAFDRANDEVGIFEVVAAELEVKELPAGTSPEPTPAGPGSGDDGHGTDATDGPTTVDGLGTDTGEPATADVPDAESGTAEPDPGAPPAGTDTDDPQPAAGDRPGADAGSDPGTGPAVGSDPEPHAGSESPGTSEPAPDQQPASDPEPGQRSAADDGPDRSPASEDDPGPAGAAPAAGDDETAPGGQPVAEEDKFSREEEWRETKSIPALDPEETRQPGDDGGHAGEPRSGTDAEPDAPSGDPQPGADAAADDRGSGGDGEPRRQRLRTELEERTAELERLRERVEEVGEQRDRLRAERDRLAERVEELESELAAARSAGGADSGGGERLAPDEALSGTNLFVQYDSRGDPTLADAHEGADREAVSENLRLKHHHTQFDPAEVSVGDQSFEAFLRSTPEYRFVEWVVGDLLYEIRETGHESALQELYDALPLIDRVELHGRVELPADDEEADGSLPFDVIFRDNTGTVLLVADVNDTRTEVDRETVEQLVAAADDISETTGLAAAFCLAASLFTDRAHDAVDEATGGSLLSRSTQKSYVQTSRKAGYHLCLVRYPEGSFDLVSPKL